MNRSIKISLTLLSVAFGTWWFFPTKNKRVIDKDEYTIDHYHEDISKIYFDLGEFARNRNDYAQAAKAYQTALENCNESYAIYDELKHLLELMNQQAAAQSVSVTQSS